MVLLVVVVRILLVIVKVGRTTNTTSEGLILVISNYINIIISN